MGGQITYIKEQLRQWRGLERIVLTEEFKDFYSDLDEEDQIHIMEFIVSGKFDALKQWMQDNKKKTLEGSGIEEIRKIAAGYDIQYYNTLSKRQLVYKIRRIRRNEYNRNAERQINEVRARFGA